MFDLGRHVNGKYVEYQGECWVVVYESYSHEGLDYYLAVKEGTPLPAVPSLIAVQRKTFKELCDEATKEKGDS